MNIPRRVNKKMRPFRFLASWTTHSDFPRFINQAGSPWCSPVKTLQEELKTWNSGVFGNIFDKKNRLVERLEIISDKLMNNLSPDMERAYKRVWKEYQRECLSRRRFFGFKSLDLNGSFVGIRILVISMLLLRLEEPRTPTICSNMAIGCGLVINEIWRG